MRFLALLFIALLAPTLTFAAAGPYENARAAWESGDFQTSLKLLRPLADPYLYFKSRASPYKR